MEEASCRFGKFGMQQQKWRHWFVQVVKCICPNCRNVFFQIVKCICPNGGGKLWIWKVWNAVAEGAAAAFKSTPSLKPTEHLERKNTQNK